MTLVVYRLQHSGFTKSRRRRLQALVGVAALAIFGACLYQVPRTLFVRTIDRPALKDTVTVTIGYDRTMFAHQNFAQNDDWEMLRQRGVTEDEIARLWTSQSIILARLALFATYLLVILSAVTFCSLEVLYGVIGPPTEP